MSERFDDMTEAFHDHLTALGVPLFALGPGNKHPAGWQHSAVENNAAERAKGRQTAGICALMGGRVAVVDVDAKSGANILDVQSSLDEAGVQVYAKVRTPSTGGFHLYVSAPAGQRTLHANKDRASLDLPGTEVIAAGGNVFAPGTRRTKYDGRGYTILWDRLDQLAGDDGSRFAAWVAAHVKVPASTQGRAQREYRTAPADGAHPYVAAAVEAECAAVASTPPGGRNAALNAAAFNLGQLVGAGVLDAHEATGRLLDAAAACGLGEAEARGTIRSGLEAGSKQPRGIPESDQRGGPRSGGSPDGPEVAEGGDNQPAAYYQHHNIADAHLAERVGRYYLRGHYLAWGRNGWAHWDGRRWNTDASLDTVRRAVVEALREIHHLETVRADQERDKRMANDTGEAEALAKEAAKRHGDRMRQLATLFVAGKIDAVMKLARGFVQCEMLDFDQHPDLLNVGNGVIDLRTGALGPHDPALLLSRITETSYVPGARHGDWDAALGAVREDVADWLQVRFGQAATGYPPDDDVVPFLRGAGANGKSTVLFGIKGALGEHATLVPDKVLLGMRNEHTTELVPLYGARFAYIEELPEGDYLEEQRLKKAVGSNGITARRIGENNFTWSATHSLMLTTNYDVKVRAVDHGTWRRLALVTFPHRYSGPGADSKADPGLRSRVERDSQVHEAVLAWLVDGARRWYEAGDRFGGRMPPLPPSVARDTKEWQERANDAAQFMSEYFDLDPGACVLRSEVYEAFKAQRGDSGRNTMSDQTFWERAAGHQWFRDGVVERAKVRTAGWTVSRRSGWATTPPATARVLTGVRWKQADSSPADEERTA